MRVILLISLLCRAVFNLHRLPPQLSTTMPRISSIRFVDSKLMFAAYSRCRGRSIAGQEQISVQRAKFRFLLVRMLSPSGSSHP